MKCITADTRGHSPSPERLVQPTWRSGSLSVSLLIQRILLNFASRHHRLGGLLCGGHGLSEFRSSLCLPGITVGKTVTVTTLFTGRTWNCSSPTATGDRAPSSRETPLRTPLSLRECLSCWSLRTGERTAWRRSTSPVVNSGSRESILRLTCWTLR